MYYLYIIENAKKRRYIGHTSNLDERLKRHNTNRSTFTKNKGPWTVVYCEEYETRSEAMRRETQLKRWNREALNRLIAANQ